MVVIKCQKYFKVQSLRLDQPGEKTGTYSKNYGHEQQITLQSSPSYARQSNGTQIALLKSYGKRRECTFLKVCWSLKFREKQVHMKIF